MSQISHQEETILDKLYVCQVDLHIWSGQVKTDMNRDIDVGAGGRLPSDKVVKAGRKYVISPDALKGFSRVRSQVRRALSRMGMPFMGGWAVPMDRKEELDDLLEKAVSEFDAYKTKLLSDYDDHVSSWISENPDDADVIRRGRLDVTDVASKLSARVKRFRISPTSEEDQAVLEQEAKGLGNELLREISEQAAKIYEDTFEGKEKVSANVRMTIKGIRDKLNGLCFLNSKFRPMVSMLDQILQGCEIHRDGRYLTSPFLYEVIAALLILSDGKKLDQMVAGIVSPTSLGAEIMPKPIQEPESGTSSSSETEPSCSDPEDSADQQGSSGTGSAADDSTYKASPEAMSEQIVSFF